MNLPEDINSTFVWLDTMSDFYSEDSIARRLSIMGLRGEYISKILDMPIERVEELHAVNRNLFNRLQPFAVKLKEELETISCNDYKDVYGLFLMGTNSIDDAVAKVLGMDKKIYYAMLQMFEWRKHF